MNILISGTSERTKELISQLPEGIDADTYDIDLDYNKINLDKYQIVFDLNMDEHSFKLKFLLEQSGLNIFVCSVKQSLSIMLHSNDMKLHKCNLFGFNALPGFISRPLKEISLSDSDKKDKLEEILKSFKWEAGIVSDRTGMVTPRIIFMIINEACFTLQEGTAGINDIDLSMKLGTNYPYGPFEWANLCGIKNIYETLNAILKDTNEERYKICPLLKSMYLKNENFIIEKADI